MVINHNHHSSISSVLLKAFVKAHGDKYSYETSVYKGAHVQIEIRCPEHGLFKQSPTAHKNGQGCPSCHANKVRERKTLNQETVLEAFRLKHGNKYDYSKFKYVSGRDKVIIICSEHGEFEQTPNAHKNGQGCPRCAGKGKTREELIQEFKDRHGERYDYSEVKWVNSITKITIICRTHGSFEQLPNAHLQGRGCRKCAIDERLKNIKNK